VKKFKTDSQRLLDLVINSIYTHREIFLRELISNASDAIDKLYFRGLTDRDVSLNRDTLAIRIAFDKAARTITVSDNGIGMSREELETNLGTIAHSGSLEFLAEHDPEGHDIDIIGQFGVGFYSSFLVAEKVRVISRAYGSEDACAWESDGKQGYTVKTAKRPEPGTDVILILKEDTDEEDYSSFLSEYRLRELVKRYSNYVRYPIQMEVLRHREKPRPDDAPKDYQPEYEEVAEIEQLNSMTPIWKRAKGEVSDEEYNSFYQAEFHDFSEPARRITLHAEGALSFDALLFIPSQAPFDLYSREYQGGLALYTSNVMIQEKCEELLPECFNFVRGVVDSADLSLNISRETLQHNHQLRAIAKRIEKKVKSDLADFLVNDREGYEKFFKDFDRTLKYGIYSDFGLKKDLLADLLIFYSAKQEKMVTFGEYLDALAEGQSDIFYAVGDSLERLKKLPIVTSALAKGYDVLLGDADVDEFVLTAMADYTRGDGGAEAADEDGKQSAPQPHALKNIATSGIELGTEEEKQEAEQAEKDNQELFTAMTEALDGAVSKVTASARLADAPVCVSSEGPISLEMEKVLAHMPLNDETVKAERVLEINTKHPVFAKLQAAFSEGRSDDVALYTKVLYGQALLIEGIPLEDPITYAQYISELF
jgi:molecular chaperone HtpG